MRSDVQRLCDSGNRDKSLVTFDAALASGLSPSQADDAQFWRAEQYANTGKRLELGHYGA
jgi:hypothetical protein